MEKTLKEIIRQRRTYYAIENKSPVTNTEIEEIIRLAVTYLPSAFNSQSSRVVLLLNQHHIKLWTIVKETLRKMVPASAFERTEQKIDAFAAGYGTVLYFEDQDVVRLLQTENPSYADRFPVWSEHASAIHQLAIWMLLEETGLGVSLQHYNPLIDEEVRQTWELPGSWKLIAQMPFGTPIQEPAPKNSNPLEQRIRIFT
ncbi:MAG: nitroreductase family protein [Planctomycetaceae bacterium]|nr:nitroreductase family protein [Planctomycetaceae bacterium]